MSNINVSIDTEQVKSQTDVAVLCKNAEIFTVIQHQAEYESASVILKSVKARYNELDKQRKEITKPIDEAKKNVMALFNEPLSLLSNAESTLKRLMIDYTNEQDRLAKLEQKRLQDLADAEAKRQQKILDEKIARAKASGKEEKVEILEEQKENIVPVSVPVIAPQIETPKGVSYRDQYFAVVKDFSKLPDEYKLPNQSALDKVAQATKGSIQIPGVVFESKKILVNRGA
jgi:hypothetical protein